MTTIKFRPCLKTGLLPADSIPYTNKSFIDLVSAEDSYLRPIWERFYFNHLPWKQSILDSIPIRIKDDNS